MTPHEYGFANPTDLDAPPPVALPRDAELDGAPGGAPPPGPGPRPARRPSPSTVRRLWILRTKAVNTGYVLLGLAVVLALWSAVAGMRPDLPSPADVLSEMKRLLSDPMANAGPNGAGVFRLIFKSLVKVFIGFLMALAVGIPLGVALGSSKTLWKMLNPVVQVLRPVSPLAWFPIWLVVFKDGYKGSVFTIAVTCLWPTLINTAFGVASVPEDHRNVGRVFRFSRVTYVRHVLLPYSLPSILTGMRLSMGVAWMVIVAAEIMSAQPGIGFFVWDSYNNNNIAAVVSAIVFIGLVGFALDLAFSKLAKRADYRAPDEGADQRAEVVA